MALLVFAGASSQSLASLLCSIPVCAKSAPAKPVAQASVEPAETHSCCASQARPASRSLRSLENPTSCCCEFAPADQPAITEVKASLPVEPTLHLALPDAPVLPEFEGVRELAVRITSASDLSPPDPPAAPDRGRAPPRV